MSANGEGEQTRDGVTKAQAGEVIRNRRLTAKIKSPNRLSDLSGVHRDTVVKVEKGDPTVQWESIDRLSAFLDTYADEPPAARLVTFRAEGVFGIASVTVQGPVDNAPETAAAFAALIAQLREESTRPHLEG